MTKAFKCVKSLVEIWLMCRRNCPTYLPTVIELMVFRTNGAIYDSLFVQQMLTPEEWNMNEPG